MIRHSRKGDGELGQPLWSQEPLYEMDRKFSAALRKAIASGEKNCATSVSTAAGTKFPVYYLPGDWG